MRAAAAALVVFVAACSAPMEPGDAGAPDAAQPDGAVPDAGAPDAGVPDSGTPDAGTPDAGAPDAGSFDAGPGDAGRCFVLDAGFSDPCLAATPACSSTCADTDGDGLNDAWERAGGVDVDSDGLITCHDVLIPGADPNHLDVFVHYDWMDWSTPGNRCGGTTQSGHRDETCVNGLLVYPCASDDDCVHRDAGRPAERCRSNVCMHTHDPEQIIPGALQDVVDAYAAHNITLHLERGRAVPHTLVTSFRRPEELTTTCEGDVADSGYASSLYEYKQIDPHGVAWHYAFFAHYSACDTQADCDACLAATNPDHSPKNAPVGGESGIAEISGNDFIVSLGNRFQDVAIPPTVPSLAGTFMHELGHNMGLTHGGGVDTLCHSDADCAPSSCVLTPVGKFCLNVQSPEINYKPTYLSMMNYRYQTAGISPAGGDGGYITCAAKADCPAGSSCYDGTCARLDYSNEALPLVGPTPGVLDPNALDESVGLGSQRRDIFRFTDSQCDIPWSIGVTQGPVDWDGDGGVGGIVTANIALDPKDRCDPGAPPIPYPTLKGYADWTAAGPVSWTFSFQCTSYAGD